MLPSIARRSSSAVGMGSSATAWGLWHTSNRDALESSNNRKTRNTLRELSFVNSRNDRRRRRAFTKDMRLLEKSLNCVDGPEGRFRTCWDALGISRRMEYVQHRPTTLR